MSGVSRRGALEMALGAGAALMLDGDASDGLWRRRPGLAFGTKVSITLRADDGPQAERAFAAGFAAIRHLDLLASLTREEGQLFRLNRDGALDAPHPDLLAMLDVAGAMHAATGGAFDVTIQPMWLAMDSAARAGRWPGAGELAALRARVDQRALTVSTERVAFDRPGMGVTLNSLARGLAADRVAAALAREGIVDAFFDTDVLGSLGRRPDRGAWRALLRHPRDAQADLGVATLRGCLATSGDYQYFWSPDHSRNHIVDPRRGASPGAFSAVSVMAPSGLVADALSTAAFLVERRDAGALVARFRAEAMFVDKAGGVERTAGFPARG